MPGYKGIPSRDPVEQQLREQWYATEGADREVVAAKLADHIWKRTEAIVAEDRLRHPKKKRNLPVPPKDGESAGGRYLP